MTGRQYGCSTAVFQYLKRPYASHFTAEGKKAEVTRQQTGGTIPQRNRVNGRKRQILPYGGAEKEADARGGMIADLQEPLLSTLLTSNYGPACL